MKSGTMRRILVAGGAALAVLTGFHVSAANASLIPIPTLDPSVTAETTENFGGQVVKMRMTSPSTLTATYAQGTTQYPGGVTFTGSGASFVYDYAFNLQGPAKLVASVGAAPTGPLLLGTAAPLTSAVPAMPSIGGVPAAFVPSTANFGLFREDGSTVTAVTGVPTLSPETLSFANLSAGEYILVVVGEVLRPGIGVFSGSVHVTAVPLPAALLLFGSGLAGLSLVGYFGRVGSKVG